MTDTPKTAEQVVTDAIKTNWTTYCSGESGTMPTEAEDAAAVVAALRSAGLLRTPGEPSVEATQKQAKRNQDFAISDEQMLRDLVEMLRHDAGDYAREVSGIPMSHELSWGPRDVRAWRAAAAIEALLSLKRGAPSNEQIERAARVLNEQGWTCSEGNDEPGRYDACSDCKRVCDEVARVMLTAAGVSPQPVIDEAALHDSVDDALSNFNGDRIEHLEQGGTDPGTRPEAITRHLIENRTAWLKGGAR